jgi:hypothetical protein
MVVLITGDRNWKCLAVTDQLAARIQRAHGGKDGKGVVVRHGAATGVDMCMEESCRSINLPTDPCPADWDDLEAPGAIIKTRKHGELYNASAGPFRNLAMRDKEPKPVDCVAIHQNLGWSRGTRNMVSLCLQASIPVYLVDHLSYPLEPRRIYGFKEKAILYNPGY